MLHRYLVTPTTVAVHGILDKSWLRHRRGKVTGRSPEAYTPHILVNAMFDSVEVGIDHDQVATGHHLLRYMRGWKNSDVRMSWRPRQALQDVISQQRSAVVINVVSAKAEVSEIARQWWVY